jgi:thiol-disulfide isomerase/thioredoxin
VAQLSPALRMGALLALFGCASGGAERPSLPQAPVAFRFSTLDGGYQTLGALRGRVVVLHILTTWSDLALLEVPRLADLARRFPNDAQVLAVVLDAEDETAAIFAETFELPYPVVRVARPDVFTGPEGPFGPIALLPTSVVLDRGGRVAARSDGTWAPGVLEDLVERLRSRGR